MSLVCGLNICTIREPRISNRVHAESSWPLANNWPLGSTATPATGLPETYNI